MPHRDAVLAEFLLEPAQGILQRHHAFDGGAPQRDAGKIVDRKRQRGGDLRKRLRHLHQRAERDQPHDVARRRDQQRKRVCQHAIRRGEHDDAHQTIGLALPAASHAAQQFLKMRPLIGIAANQGDAFRIFPGPRQAKAEIGFHRLPQVGGADQRESRPQRQAGADRRIDKGDEDHEAGDGNDRPADFHVDDAGELPQHGDECRKEQDAVEQGLAQIDGRLGRHADVLGDASVRIVVVLAHDQAELIVPSLRHPDRQGVPGDPDAPGELQAPLGIKRYGEHEDACQKQQHEGHDQLEERFEVTALYRVVEPRRPGVQADLDRNLGNRQDCDQRQTAAVHPFVLGRPEGQGEKDEAPEKADGIAYDRRGAGAAGRRILCHGLGSRCLAQPAADAKANTGAMFCCVSKAHRSHVVSERTGGSPRGYVRGLVRCSKSSLALRGISPEFRQGSRRRRHFSLSGAWPLFDEAPRSPA